jgi:hypothetical protein
MVDDYSIRVHRFDVSAIRNLRVRWPGLAVWLAVAVAAWSASLAAADASCEMIDKRLIDIGKKAAEAKKISAPDDKTILRLAVNQLANEPSPFHVELSSQTFPGRGAAWVTFEDKQIAALADANPDKVCVKAFSRASEVEPVPVTIKQVFLFAKDDATKRLKVVFQVGRAPSDLYSGVDYLFVGVLAGTPPTFFNYSKEVTVANNRTTTALSWLFVAAAMCSSHGRPKRPASSTRPTRRGKANRVRKPSDGTSTL